MALKETEDHSCLLCLLRQEDPVQFGVASLYQEKPPLSSYIYGSVPVENLTFEMTEM